MKRSERLGARIDEIVRERAERESGNLGCGCWDSSCWDCLARQAAGEQALIEDEREACARLVTLTRRALEAKAKASGGADPATVELFNVLDAITKRIRARGQRRSK